MARSRRDFLRSLGLGAAVGAASHWPLGVAASAEPSRARKGDGFIHLDSNEYSVSPPARFSAPASSSYKLHRRLKTSKNTLKPRVRKLWLCPWIESTPTIWTRC